MTLLDEIRSRIVEPDPSIRGETQRLLDAKTKPRRSLGRLEDLACEIAAMRGTSKPEIPQKAIIVMAGDHGVSEEGVSAFPKEVTRQMVANFATGGAAINVLGRYVGARIEVEDMGVGKGTANFTRGPAMRRDEAIHAVEIGIRKAETLVAEEVTLLGLGDMGIGNTTASSAMTAVFLGLEPEEVTGRGTGVDDAGFARKVGCIQRALEVNRADPKDALDILAKLGGFEIAGLAGVVLAAAACRVPVLLDGFITTAAALAAVRLEPRARSYLIASHRSVEVGHSRILDALGLDPLLDFGLRLGEGTGSALAMGIIDAAIRILHEMATFESAGVTDARA